MDCLNATSVHFQAQDERGRKKKNTVDDASVALSLIGNDRINSAYEEEQI